MRLAASRVMYFNIVEQDSVVVFNFGEKGRRPLRHVWDPREPRLVCVDTCVDTYGAT